MKLAIAAAAATLVFAAPAWATYPGANGRIAFGHDGGIWTVASDGSGLQQVTSGPTDDGPDWAPDGRSIAFTRAPHPDDPFGRAVWVVAADGSGARQVSMPRDNAFDFVARFTPDGQRIFYQDCLGGDCDGGIFSVGVDGSSERHNTPNSHDSYNWPAVAPDGKRLAYQRWHVGGTTMRIYVSDLSGKGQRPLTPIKLAGWAPDWAPDGKHLLFSSHNYGYRPGGALYRVGTGGRGVRRLTHAPFPHSDFQGSYSPDGKQIAFVSDRRARRLNHTDLYVANADGSGLHRVPLPFRDVFDPRWGSGGPATP